MTKSITEVGGFMTQAVYLALFYQISTIIKMCAVKMDDAMVPGILVAQGRLRGFPSARILIV